MPSLEILNLLLPWLFIGGLVVGSFLNVLTTRLANDEPFFKSRSFCPHCRQALSADDLIPVISFLWLRGRCRYCHKSISWQYPIVELATGLAWLAVGYAHLMGSAAGESSLVWLARDLFFTSGLIALFVFDYQWFIVPDEVSLPLSLLAFLINLALGLSFWSLVLGSIIGAGVYFLLWAGSAGRWVGSGDIRLGLVLGTMLGWPGTIAALYVAYLIGGAVALILLLTKKSQVGSMLPMGTFLTLGAFTIILFTAKLPTIWAIFF